MIILVCNVRQKYNFTIIVGDVFQTHGHLVAFYNSLKKVNSLDKCVRFKLE